MPELFTILLKINLVLILFAVAYYLVLRKLTFYTINRVFLVFGIIFSSLFPFIDLTEFFHSQQQFNQGVVGFVPQLNQKANELVPTNFIALHWQLISLVFYIGVAIMALRLIMQFVSLYLMHQKSKPGAVNNYPVRVLNQPVSPFSFWQTVYINPSLHKEDELQTILAHEQIHVKQWHSLDIILAELSVVFYWFNPGVWLMKKAVKENLEFITDQKILNKGIDRKAYQYSLLDVGSLSPAAAIVNNFNLSDLKKRIKMMNVKRSSRLTLSRYLLITPVLLVTTLAFTVAKKDIKTHLLPLQRVLIKNIVITKVVATKRSTSKKTFKKRSLNSVEPKKLDTTNKMAHFFKTIFITTDSLPVKVTADLKISSALLTGKITQIRISDSSGKATSGVAGVPLPFGVAQDLTANSDAHGSGANARTFKHIVTVKGYRVQTQPEDNNRVIIRAAPTQDSSTLKDAIFTVNGKKITIEEIKNLKPEEIQTITVEKKKMPNEVLVIGKKNP